MREAARRLGIDRGTTLPDLIRSGQIRTVVLAGRVKDPGQRDRANRGGRGHPVGISEEARERAQSREADQAGSGDPRAQDRVVCFTLSHTPSAIHPLSLPRAHAARRTQKRKAVRLSAS